jgi:hypothetical protein
MFTVDGAIGLDSLKSGEVIVEDEVITIEKATEMYPTVKVNADGELAVGQGKPLRSDWIESVRAAKGRPGTFRVLNGTGMLIALYGPPRSDDDSEITGRAVRVLRPSNLKAKDNEAA